MMMTSRLHQAVRSGGRTRGPALRPRLRTPRDADLLIPVMTQAAGTVMAAADQLLQYHQNSRIKSVTSLHERSQPALPSQHNHPQDTGSPLGVHTYVCMQSHDTQDAGTLTTALARFRSSTAHSRPLKNANRHAYRQRPRRASQSAAPASAAQPGHHPHAHSPGPAGHARHRCGARAC